MEFLSLVIFVYFIGKLLYWIVEDLKPKDNISINKIIGEPVNFKKYD